MTNGGERGTVAYRILNHYTGYILAFDATSSTFSNETHLFIPTEGGGGGGGVVEKDRCSY